MSSFQCFTEGSEKRIEFSVIVSRDKKVTLVTPCHQKWTVSCPGACERLTSEMRAAGKLLSHRLCRNICFPIDLLALPRLSPRTWKVATKTHAVISCYLVST